MTQLPALIGRTRLRDCEPESSPIVRIQKLLFAQAETLGASDIHIEPGRVCTRVRCRVDGGLRQIAELPRWMHENLVVRMKVLAHLDVADRRIPQDGHIDAESSGAGDIRVSTIPTRWGEKIVLRILKRSRHTLSLARLGLPATFESTLHAWIHRSQGILFVVGPTGSGKTTTLYGLINELRDESLNVVTIEDPIEYEADAITQVQVNEKAGLSFARCLRAILRQDPDVILVGEIRDTETARIAIQAAMTGHLVLSTLHAVDAVSAFSRLAELGVERTVAAQVILGIVAQRLVRLNCPSCAEPEEPPQEYLESLQIPRSGHGRFMSGRGCGECGYSGCRGRAGLFELLDVDESIREWCIAGEAVLRRSVRDSGGVSIGRQAAALAAAGAISAEEAYRFGYSGSAS